MTLEAKLTELAAALGADVKALKAGAETGGVSMIWAEEASAISASTNSGYQWSFGNGDLNNYGVVIGFDCSIKTLAIASAATMTAGVVEIYVNQVATGATVSVTGYSAIADVDVAISKGDAVTFRTISGSGGSGVVVSASLETSGVRGEKGEKGDIGSYEPMPFFVTDSSGGVACTTTAATVVLDSAQISNDNYTLSSGAITVSTAGTYEISYSLSVDETNQSGGARCSFEGWIENNGSEVVGSRTNQYYREAAAGSSLTKTFPVVLSAGDVLSLRMIRTFTAQPNFETSAGNKTSFYIKKLT